MLSTDPPTRNFAIEQLIEKAFQTQSDTEDKISLMAKAVPTTAKKVPETASGNLQRLGELQEVLAEVNERIVRQHEHTLAEFYGHILFV